MGVVRLTLEYDGGGFRGWAAQPGMRTIEATLAEGLEAVLRHPVTLSVAGRTDAGVHAWGQVASFETPRPEAVESRRLNGVLPDDLAILEADPAPDGFDARRDARSRTYCYRLLARSAPSPLERGRALWWPHRTNRAALDACARALVGSRDFTAFTPTETEHVRFGRDVLRAEWRETGGQILELWIEADAFMRHMVRVLVGTMLEVAGGRRDPDDFARLLDGAPRESAGETAPAHGLYLAGVRYQAREQE